MLQDEELIEINMTYAWDSVVLLEGLLKSIYDKSYDLSCTIVYPEAGMLSTSSQDSESSDKDIVKIL